MAHHIAPGANFSMRIMWRICGACAAAVGAIEPVPVATCSACICAGVVCADAIKRCIAACTYVRVAMGYRIQGAGCRVQVHGELVML